MQKPGLILRGLVLRASQRYSVDFWTTQSVGTVSGRIWQDHTKEIVGSWNHSIWNPSQGLDNWRLDIERMLASPHAGCAFMPASMISAGSCLGFCGVVLGLLRPSGV